MESFFHGDLQLFIALIKMTELIILFVKVGRLKAFPGKTKLVVESVKSKAGSLFTLKPESVKQWLKRKNNECKNFNL